MIITNDQCCILPHQTMHLIYCHIQNSRRKLHSPNPQFHWEKSVNHSSPTDPRVCREQNVMELFPTPYEMQGDSASSFTSSMTFAHKTTYQLQREISAFQQKCLISGMLTCVYTTFGCRNTTALPFSGQSLYSMLKGRREHLRIRKGMILHYMPSSISCPC